MGLGRRRWLRALLVALGAGLLCACAATQLALPRFDVQAQPAAAAGSGDAKIAVLRFRIETGKEDDRHVGEAKTGIFNRSTPIRAAESLDELLLRSISTGFRHAGYEVVPPQDADFVVEGTLEEFWVEEYATGFSLEYSTARVRFDAIVKNAGGTIVWARSCEGFETSGKNAETTSLDLPTLKAATARALNSMFRDPALWEALSNPPV